MLKVNTEDHGRVYKLHEKKIRGFMERIKRTTIEDNIKIFSSNTWKL